MYEGKQRQGRRGRKERAEDVNQGRLCCDILGIDLQAAASPYVSHDGGGEAVF